VTVLVVMRLAEMRRVHPDMITSLCDGCGHKVGIYPSGQRVIAAQPRTEVRCSYCVGRADITVLAPGAIEESKQSIPASGKKQ